MASLPYESILRSDFFKFIVGPEKREFFVHSSIVACQSECIEKLVKGDMKEAIERCATLSDVDSDTFVRFSRYAYTGDYMAAQRQTREHMRFTEPSPPQSPVLYSEPPKVRKKKISSFCGGDVVQTKDKDLWSHFKRLYPDSVSDRVPAGNAPEDDFTGIFLSHAHLYVFADCYDISTLKLLCLRKLQRALENFTVHEEAIDDVVRLLLFCYENTLESDEMRDMLNMFAACKAVELWRSQEFQRLVRDSGEFAWGLVSEMLKRVD